MKVTYNWLKSLVDFDLSPEELVDTLTMLGFEVDSFDPLDWRFDGMVVGEVTKKEKHPNADKLSLCEVNIGSGNLPIVCGAPNVAAGQKVPVATDGTKLPGGHKIKTTEIRGVKSQGMICSESELGISSRADGIMVLEDEAKIGEPLQEVLGKGDIAIDIDVTPNRPDCFGVIGIAREIAAVTESELKKPEINIEEDGQSISELFKVSISDSDKCPRFTARYIGNVKIKPSPWWLAQRLEAIGIRSINNIVDVTNFIMMETGHPLHAYDYDTLAGHEIIVKTAAKGEKFTTLDDNTHTLDPEFLMICDKKRSVGVGGIMGGLNTEVSDKTRNILLECAYFNPVTIRRSSKRLGVVTEASKRFERGVDPNGQLYALDRAAQLMAELGKGSVAKDVIDEYPNQIHPVKIKLRPNRVSRLLGVEIPKDRTKEILSRLEFKVSGEDEFSVEAPTFRPDITREADLIEEVARLYGYDNIPEDTTAFIEQLRPSNPNEVLANKLKDLLISSGFSEVMTYVLIKKSAAELFTSDETIQLLNPLSEDLSTLRPSLIPGLLNTLSWNINRKNKNLKIFELGTGFEKAENGVKETMRIAGALTGSSSSESWQKKSDSFNIYDVKGLVEYFLNRIRVNNWNFAPAKISFIGKALSLEIGSKTVGFLGELSHEILNEFDIEQPVFVFDIHFDLLLKNIESQKSFAPIPKFPPVERDIAIVVDERIDVEKIAQEVSRNGGRLLQNINLFDVFKGEQVGAGLKSLAFNLTFYSLERTLKEKEVDKQISKILNSLSTKFSAQLRD